MTTCNPASLCKKKNKLFHTMQWSLEFNLISGLLKLLKLLHNLFIYSRSHLNFDTVLRYRPGEVVQT